MNLMHAAEAGASIGTRPAKNGLEIRDLGVGELKYSRGDLRRGGLSVSHSVTGKARFVVAKTIRLLVPFLAMLNWTAAFVSHVADVTSGSRFAAGIPLKAKTPVENASVAIVNVSEEIDLRFNPKAWRFMSVLVAGKRGGGDANGKIVGDGDQRLRELGRGLKNPNPVPHNHWDRTR